MRVTARVFGTLTEPAGSFVRGCQGHVVPEEQGARFEVTAPMPALSFSAAGDGVRSMVLGTPDGLYRCALADDQGFATTDLAQAAAGAYTVWVGGDQGAELAAQVIASGQPVSPIEIFGLDPERLGEPRAGRFVFAASAETGRQVLAESAALFADVPLDPLSSDYCPGYGRLDAADAVLTLDQATSRFSLFAMSDRDLTMAVLTPSGQVLCNDDSYQLNPAVTIDGAEAGNYHVFVGGYSQGGTGRYDLYASQGGPAFSNATFNPEAEPIFGRAVLDMNEAGNGQTVANGTLTGTDPMESLPVGGFCPGVTDISAPTAVLTLDQSVPMFSLYARSSADTVLAVRAPDGSWQCNDDSFELNPAVSFSGAQPGDYLAYVGSYNPGSSDPFTLFASLGSANWGATPGAGTGTTSQIPLNAAAEPLLGTIDFGPGTRIDPRIIFDIQPSQNEAFGMGEGCAGFIHPEAPDLVINAESGLPQMMVYVASDADGTLAIVGPDGHLFCNDDFEQLNPGVVIYSPMAGSYSVFVGTYGGNGGLATMGVTVANPQWVMDREH
ncbi:MAG: hypothetical protein R3D60_05195 [Paracoccaceae bacterium]